VPYYQLISIFWHLAHAANFGIQGEEIYEEVGGTSHAVDVSTPVCTVEEGYVSCLSKLQI